MSAATLVLALVCLGVAVQSQVVRHDSGEIRFVSRPRQQTLVRRPTIVASRDEEYPSIPPKYGYFYVVESEPYGTYIKAEERRQDARVEGEYSYLDPNGDLVTVSYYADETGYHPTTTIQRAYNPFNGNGRRSGERR